MAVSTSKQVMPSADREPTVSFRDLVDEKFQRVWDRFIAIDERTQRSNDDLAAYKVTANEFRSTLADQAARLVTKDELKQQAAAAEIQRLRVDNLEKTSANMQGRIWMLAAIFAVIQVAVNIAQRFIPHIP